MSKFSLEALYDAHADALHGFLLNLTRDREDTRDLLQSTFIRLARQDQLGSIKRPRSYLFRIAHRLWLDLLRERGRREKRLEHLQQNQPVFEEPQQGDRDLHAVLTRQLAQLPHEQRCVLYLRIWEDLSFSEIASLIDCPKATAVSRFRYALDRLRAALPDIEASHPRLWWVLDHPPHRNEA